MKAPDKMYYKVLENQYLPITTDIVSTEGAIEYIRKDALMEILQGYSHPLTKLVMQEIIDKINSL